MRFTVPTIVVSLEFFQMSMPWKKSTDTIKRLLIKDPNLTSTQLQELLAEKGLRVGPWTIAFVRQEFLSDIRIVQDCGHWVDIESKPVVHARRRKLVYGWEDYPEWRKRNLPKTRKPFRPWRFSG
jgi:hypothetical protein